MQAARVLLQVGVAAQLLPEKDFVLVVVGKAAEIKEQLATVATDKRMKHLEAILNSMTPVERANHNLVDGKRKRRVSAGSGRPVSEINQLLKQFVETRKMMGQMNDPRFMARMQRMAKMGGGPNLPF